MGPLDSCFSALATLRCVEFPWRYSGSSSPESEMLLRLRNTLTLGVKLRGFTLDGSSLAFKSQLYWTSQLELIKEAYNFWLKCRIAKQDPKSWGSLCPCKDVGKTCLNKSSWKSPGHNLNSPSFISELHTRTDQFYMTYIKQIELLVADSFLLLPFTILCRRPRKHAL